MKLATLKDGSRDGRLVVVSRDLTRCTDASFLAPNLQAALDDWQRISPHLAALAQSLEVGSVPWLRFHEHDTHSPLPRAFQHIGCGDAFTGPRDPVVFGAGATSLEISCGAAVICGDVDTGADAAGAREAIVLVMLSSHTGPAGDGTTAFSPVAVTPDEIAADWDGKLAQFPAMTVNARPVSPTDSKAVVADFPETIALAAKTRPLSAGAILAAAPAAHAADIRSGDIVRMEMKDRAGHSIFGAIEQTVSRHGDP